MLSGACCWELGTRSTSGAVSPVHRVHWGVSASLLHCETWGFPDIFSAQKLWDVCLCKVENAAHQRGFVPPIAQVINASTHAKTTAMSCSRNLFTLLSFSSLILFPFSYPPLRVLYLLLISRHFLSLIFNYLSI